MSLGALAGAKPLIAGFRVWATRDTPLLRLLTSPRSVHHTHEHQPLGRRSGPGERTISSRQEFPDPGRGPSAPPNFDQRPHQVSNHVMQEAVCRQENDEPPPPEDQARRAHCADRTAPPSGRGAERREVVLASHESERLAHRGRVEPEREVPSIAAEKGVGEWAAIDEVSVALSPGRAPRVEGGWGFGRVQDSDGRWQEGVERATKGSRFDGRRRDEARHLPERMHPGVGAARPDHSSRRP